MRTYGSTELILFSNLFYAWAVLSYLLNVAFVRDAAFFGGLGEVFDPFDVNRQWLGAGAVRQAKIKPAQVVFGENLKADYFSYIG